MNLVNNPNNIFNLKLHYPVIYDTTIISVDCKDSLVVSEWYDLLKNFPKINNSNLNYRTRGFSDTFIDKSKKKMKIIELEPKNFVNIILMKTCSKGIIFYFVKKNNEYYFFSMNEFVIYSGNDTMDCN